MEQRGCRTLDQLLRNAQEHGIIEYYELGADIVSFRLHGALIALRVDCAYHLLQPMLTWWAERRTMGAIDHECRPVDTV